MMVPQPRAFVASLLLALAFATTATAGDYQRGFQDGWKFAYQAAQERGQADGRAAGDTAGHAQGLEDERARQLIPAAGGASSVSGSGDVIGSPDSDFVDGLRRRALQENPELVPGALSEEGPQDPDPVTSPLAYTRGFGEGLAAGMAKGYLDGRQRGYAAGFAAGHDRGCNEYRRLYRRADGSYIAPTAEIELGRQAALAGRYPEALQRFDVAITAEGAGGAVPEALYWKAFTYYEMKRPAEALQSLQRLLTHFPGCPHEVEAWFLAGASFERTPARGLEGVVGRKRYAESNEMYQRVVEKAPGSAQAPEALYRIGINHFRLGDREAAVRAFRDLLERYPSSSAAPMARESLDRLTRGA